MRRYSPKPWVPVTRRRGEAAIDGRTVISESAISLFEDLAGAEPPADGPVLFETACVLGGSVAGLLAARVLSEHARRVVIVERDDLSVAGEPRPGVPQDKQVHTLLPAGALWLERWFPGLPRHAQDLGATLAEPGQVLMAVDGRPQPRTEGDFRLLPCSRRFPEARIRERVGALPNVEIRHGRASGLVHGNTRRSDPTA